MVNQSYYRIWNIKITILDGANTNTYQKFCRYLIYFVIILTTKSLHHAWQLKDLLYKHANSSFLHSPRDALPRSQHGVLLLRGEGQSRVRRWRRSISQNLVVRPTLRRSQFTQLTTHCYNFTSQNWHHALTLTLLHFHLHF